MAEAAGAPPGHRPRRRFGQNFLHQRGVVERMVSAIDPRPGQALLEIGPGLGALTLPLLERAGAMDALELDRDLLEPLAAAARDVGELRLHEADALEADLSGFRRGEKRLRVVGNLPYNISTPLLFHLLGQRAAVEDMHLLLQREVVARLAAGPGGRDYGRLSVMVQLHCRVKPLFDVAPGAFRPPPKVTSSFVRLVPRAAPAVALPEPAAFAELVRLAFAGRRKTLRNALRGVLGADGFARAGVAPGLRAERLALADFGRLAQALADSRAQDGQQSW